MQPTLRFLTGILLASILWIPVLQAQNLEESQVGRFQLAESFLRAAQYERAIGMLETLYEESPGTHVFYERLREAYESVKRYDAAIALVDRKMATESAPTSFLAEKARLLFLKGDEAGARAQWDAAIATNPSSPSVYLLVYRSLMDLRLFDWAIDVLEKGRTSMDNETLFQTDLAYLYNLTSQPAKAVEKYLELLSLNQNQLSYIKSQLSQFLTSPEAIEECLVVARDGVAREPLNRAYREFLGWLLVEGDAFREALEVYRGIDRLEREQGRMLFGFGLVAADGGAWDVALEAFDEVLQRYPEAASAPEAMRGLAMMQEKWAEEVGERVFDTAGNRLESSHWDEALATYQRFLIEYPQHPQYPDVLRRIGALQQDVFFDLPAAETVLTEVVSRYPQTDAADQAAYDLGRLAVTEGRLEDARMAFTRLLTRLRTGDLADLARYELALLHFYQGDFEAAESFTRAMQENTSTDVANNAIDMKVLLIESMGPDSLNTPLRRFARIQLLTRQRDYNVAEHQLDDLMDEFGQHALADDMMMQKAELQARSGQSEAAISTFLQIPLLFPRGFFGARALMLAADLQTEIGLEEDALRTYQRVLTEFPGSLLIPRVRESIRRLRGENV
ncbi:MAG: tetratricopeptide repeat protein [Bacteroidetes bacterium]|nr:tetratricopeptide repeat protein [Bacteroidota bacterium]